MGFWAPGEGAKRETAVRRTILIQVWADDSSQCFQGRAVEKRERMPPAACLNGEEHPNRCGYSPAQKHRRNAHGVVRNTIKHTSTRKVPVAGLKAVQARARPINTDFLPSRDLCFCDFVL